MLCSLSDIVNTVEALLWIHDYDLVACDCGVAQGIVPHGDVFLRLIVYV